ncbi:MAG: DUF4215 domain-containing protein [Candidatus Buchananbacteria bacterium]|nr:DUF4215 domain-containing protein [Candidatus Buchananbacteria bacterium]
MLQKNKKLILFSGLILFLGGFLFFSNQPISAADVTVSGEVPSTSQCVDSSTCNSNEHYNGCVCVPNISCIPSTYSCLWGVCVDGYQNGICSNGCVTVTQVQACTPESCGDGVWDEFNEECDSGPLNGQACVPDGGYGSEAFCRYCSDMCKTITIFAPYCGDGLVQTDYGETCEPPNQDNCDNNCHTILGCGNGVIEPEKDEICDDGNLISGDGCDNNCQPTGCGNGFTTPETGEECDDSNTISGDGCSANCILENCGNGQLDNGEQCDDGNQFLDDACDTFGQAPETRGRCTATFCGDGFVQTVNGEQCDDGNNVSGDGCSGSCYDELIILNHSVASIQSDSARIIWQTNFNSSSVLQWQQADGQGQGSAEGGLIGTNLAYTINNLQPGTWYTYTIVATRQSAPHDQDTKSREFFTTAIGFCPDGICNADETPETCPQDCRVVCDPEWSLGSWSECVNSIQTREVINLKPECPGVGQPPDQRCCGSSCNVACGICQNISVANNTCTPVHPCCGNRICESPENADSCPVDCAVSPSYGLVLNQCADGKDNDNDGLVDYPDDSGCSSPTDNSELNFSEVISRIIEIMKQPLVQKANEQVVAPAVIALATLNSLSAFSLFNLLTYLRYILTQPLALLSRRKRKKWGTVYNSLSKQPIDLAIVRLFNKNNGQLVQSRVTDKNGRFSFLAPPGLYYLTVTKPKFNFPTGYLKEKKEDVKFLDLYHGETLKVTEQNANIVVNIPIDPLEDTRPPKKIIFQYYARKVQYAVAFSAVPIAALSLAISPSLFTATLFLIHILLYILFRRLGYQKKPKSWGIVYDQDNKKPVGLAITRIYDKVYNKLLESRVTDARGRYAFLVDNNIYTVTAEKLGYSPSKIDEINLMGGKKDTIVDLNIALNKGAIAQPATPQTSTESAAQTPPTPVQPSRDDVATQLSSVEKEVSRESLEELLKTKEKLAGIEKTIDQKQAELENLEKQAQGLEQKVEQEISEKKQPLVKEDESEPKTKIETKPESVSQPTGQPAALQTPPAPLIPETKPESPSQPEAKPEEKKESADQPKPSIFG